MINSVSSTIESDDSDSNLTRPTTYSITKVKLETIIPDNFNKSKNLRDFKNPNMAQGHLSLKHY